ncbi:MAG: redoxin domain-containing protein [Aestuariibaculum sp.]
MKRRSTFFNTLEDFKNNNKNKEKWNQLLQISQTYFEKDDILFTEDYNTICWHIFLNYKKFNSPEALTMAKSWAQKAIEKNPNNPHMNETYANILFETGLVNEAVKYQQIATDKLKKQGHKWAGMYEERLERFKAHLNDETITVGSKYIDVVATNLDAEDVKLSQVINRKTSLLVFWRPGSLYGLEKLRELFPVYQKYKNKDFVVVGIAGAFKSTQNVERITKNENILWTNLVDLDRRNRIWDKYNVLNTDFRTFLIDEKGFIVAIDTTVETLGEELGRLLHK